MGQRSNTNSLHLLNNKNSSSLYYADYIFYSAAFEQDFYVYMYLRAQCTLKYNAFKRKHLYEVEITKSCIYRIEKARILFLELIYLKNKGLKKKYLKMFITQIYKQIKKLFFMKNNFFLSYKVGKHNAKFNAFRIATLLEKRIKFRSKVIKNLIKNTNSLGIRVICKGRLNFVDRARKDQISIGSVPLQVFDANIDYSVVVANTKKGLQSIKIWIFNSNK
jgi:ribosomal protein S3